MTIFRFHDSDALGKVTVVDTISVIVGVSNVDLLRRLQVNRLVALQSSRAGQHLIGLIQKVTRKSLGVEEGDIEEEHEESFCKVSLVGTLIDRLSEKRNVFRRTIETVPEIDANCFPVEGETLTAFMRIISSSADERHSLILGNYTLDDAAEAHLNGNKFFQRHAFIGGSTGSGKSWTTAKVLEQVARLKNANVLVFDVHGEYGPISGNGVSHYKIAGPSDVERKSKLSDGIIYIPYWLLSYEALVSMFVDRSDQNAPNQAMVMSREIVAVKRKYLEAQGQTAVLNNFTIDSPVPFNLDDLLSSLNAINLEMVQGSRGGEKQGEFYGRLSRMIARLENKKMDRRLGFLFQGGADVLRVAWLDEIVQALLSGTEEGRHGGVKIIDFSEVPSDILPLIVSLIAQLAFSIQQWAPAKTRHPVALFCDEAHLYIPDRSSASTADDISIEIFERIAKEGRKYGVGLVVVSQRPSEVNRTVLSQVSNFIAMRLTNADDQAVIRRLLPDSIGGMGDVLPVLDTGEAIVVGDASLLPSRVRIAPPVCKPNSGTIEFWDEWLGDTNSERLSKAVSNWRNQTVQ